MVNRMSRYTELKQKYLLFVFSDLKWHFANLILCINGLMEKSLHCASDIALNVF